MLELFYKLLGREAVNSKDVASERLRLVLVHDRAAISPDIIELIKEDIVHVIEKYMNIDTEALLMHIENVDHSVALVANIPILSMRRPEDGDPAILL
jgi:cell division topological specificity factor